MGNGNAIIVLVDDNETHLALGRDILSTSYLVYTAQSVAKLFEIIENIIPNLILLDIEMPEINGYEALRNLRADQRFADIPVIFVTSHKDSESELKSLNLGADDYVTKPFAPVILLKRIENVLNNKRKSSAEESASENLGEPSAQDTNGKGSVINKLCILAVDDAPDILKSINYVLRDEYKVATLAQPEKIKELLQKITPDLFLLDYNMPLLNGFDLIPIIRGLKEHSKTPIMFLTSEGTMTNLSVALELGACDFIVKPFKPDVLREKIAMHISKGTTKRG
jgi:DNA-binding response OmpR family regulator